MYNKQDDLIKIENAGSFRRRYAKGKERRGKGRKGDKMWVLFAILFVVGFVTIPIF